MIRLRQAAGAFALATAMAFTSAPAAMAAGSDILFDVDILQADFDNFVKEAGAATAYNPAGPIEPHGVIGFDIGIAVTMVDIDNSLWNQAVADADAPSSLPVPRLQARKGLPFGIDVGVSYIKVPSSDVSVIGGEIRKAILDGSMATPAVGILVHYSTMQGVDQLDLSSYGVDLGISKGVLMFTPYAGVGQVWVSGSANLNAGRSGALPALEDADESFTRAYVGLKFSPMPLINIALQADFGEVSSYTVRANLGL